MNQRLKGHSGYLVVVLLNLAAFAGLAFALRQPTRGLVEILPPPTITPAPWNIPQDGPLRETAYSTGPAPTPTPQVLTVYVSGAVARPGVYILPDHSRVERAVNAAGGFAEDATKAGVNLAQPLMDGQQVHVPREGEAPLPVAAAGSPFSGDQPGPININTATVEQLTTYRGSGRSWPGVSLS